MKRKSKTRLPRLSLLSMSARELERFSAAVEKTVSNLEPLELLAVRLIVACERLEALAAAQEQRRPRARRSVPAGGLPAAGE